MQQVWSGLVWQSGRLKSTHEDLTGGDAWPMDQQGSSLVGGFSSALVAQCPLHAQLQAPSASKTTTNLDVGVLSQALTVKYVLTLTEGVTPLLTSQHQSRLVWTNRQGHQTHAQLTAC